MRNVLKVFCVLSLILAMPVDAEERYLVPVFVDVPGANGARFVSDLTVFNAGPTGAIVRGFRLPCVVALCPPLDYRWFAEPGASDSLFERSGAPGLIIKTPTGAGVRMSLRVRDSSRAHLSAGTEIPVVHESEMQMETVFLLNVPGVGTLFRNRLRIYSFNPGRVRVSIIQQANNVVLADFALDLRYPPAATENAAEFYPAFAETADFPPSIGYLRIQVEPTSDIGSLWAFATTTNNVTNEITVVTPQH